MPKLPDLSGYSLDNLNQLIAAANRRTQELRVRRIRELEAELDRLGTGPNGAHRSRPTRQGNRAGSSGGRSKEVRAGKKVAAQFRGPNGEEYSGRGAIPRWARDLGVNDREALEKFRIS